MKESPTALKSLKSGETPQELTFIYDRIVPVLAALDPVIHEFKDNEERIAFLLTALGPFEELFVAMVQSKRSSQQPIPLETAIRLYGARQAFGLLIGMNLVKAVQGDYPAWQKGGEPDMKIEEVLPCATRLREHFGVSHRAHFEIGITGLVFDVLLALARKESSHADGIQELIKAQIEQGIRLAETGVKQARGAKGLRLENFMESVIFLKRTGRVIMSIVHEKYLDFAGQISDGDFRSPFVHLAEIRAFGVSNNVLSCLLCKFIPGLNEVNAALLFYDYPFMMKDGLTRNDLYELVQFCHGLDQAQRLEGV